MTALGLGAAAGLQTRIEAARGDRPPDLVLKGGRVVDVFAGRLLETEVAICEGRVVGFGDL